MATMRYTRRASEMRPTMMVSIIVMGYRRSHSSAYPTQRAKNAIDMATNITSVDLVIPNNRAMPNIARKIPTNVLSFI